MDQRDLVERAGKGDHDAFAVLAHGSASRLDAIARLILRDGDLAREAVQDALVRAWRDLSGSCDPRRGGPVGVQPPASERPRMFPSESLNQAPFRPLGSVMMPSTVWKSSPKS